MAAYTFATSLLARDGTDVTLNAHGLVFKIHRDHFGTIPVVVSGNSPPPIPADPRGGEQTVTIAGCNTFPPDVVAEWTSHHHTLTVAVLNPTAVDQTIELNFTGVNRSGKDTLWRLASAGDNGQNPDMAIHRLIPLPNPLTFRVSV